MDAVFAEWACTSWTPGAFGTWSPPDLVSRPNWPICAGRFGFKPFWWSFMVPTSTGVCKINALILLKRSIGVRFPSTGNTKGVCFAHRYPFLKLF